MDKIMDVTNLAWFKSMKPTHRIALVIVLVGIALFLIVPLIVGAGNYPIVSGDRITSWNFSGAYADNGPNQARTIAEIQSLKAKLGKDKTKDYDLLVGIASEYELLGEGRSAYHYLSKAIGQTHARGLAYMNMGQLMESLGAYRTAAKAFDAALKAEPKSGIFASARDSFYSRHPQQ